MKNRCGRMLKSGFMSEPRPCWLKKGHGGGHSPDLTEMEFGAGIVVSRALNYTAWDGRSRTRWNFRNQFGDIRSVSSTGLIRKKRIGTVSNRGMATSTIDKYGKTRPEYRTVNFHYDYIVRRRHGSYKNIVFYDGWNPLKGGHLKVGMLWIIEKLGLRPGLSWQLHVLKTRKYPYGFFGPGGIVWRHAADRHDQQVLDVVAEWPNKKFEEFVKAERIARNTRKNYGRKNFSARS